GHWLHFTYVPLLIAAYFVSGISESKDLKILIAYIAVFVYVLVLMGLLAYFIISYSRKARYAEAMYCIHSAIHQIRDINIYLAHCLQAPIQYEAAHFEHRFCSVLNSVAQAFDIATAVSNRVCVKLIGGPKGSEYAKTLSRDSASRIQSEKKDKAKAETHLINKNTDFHLIVSNELRYFCENNLRKYPNYCNTSLDPTNGHSGSWSLPYSACLVFPIRFTTVEKSDDGQAEDRISILGFLAIDSAARGVYEKRYDVEMGAIIADTLVSVLQTWSIVDAKAKTAKEVAKEAAKKVAEPPNLS
ncbi:MAG: hypothetical protein ACXU8A_05280, partial [Burkholderiaceae bacterium]